jgi:hypothetical protein
MVSLGVFWVNSSPVAMALVVMGGGAAILGIVLNLAEGPVQISPTAGLRFTLRQRVIQMSAERKLSKDVAATAVADAKAVERRAKRQPAGVLPTTDQAASKWLASMTEAQELLKHRENQEDRRKAESIVDAVAKDIVSAAPRRVRRKKKAPRR